MSTTWQHPVNHLPRRVGLLQGTKLTASNDGPGARSAYGVVSRLVLFSLPSIVLQSVLLCPPVLLSLLSSLTDCFSPATPIETVETISHCL